MCVIRTCARRASHRVGQGMVPQQVNDESGRPISHGTVERAYDRLREIGRRYCLDEQEAGLYDVLHASCHLQ